MRFLSLIILLCMPHIAYPQNAMWVVLPQYDQITPFNEGVAAVSQNGKWGYINEDGGVVASCKYDRVYPFSEGVGVATTLDGTIAAIIDKNGTAINEFQNESGQKKSYKVDPRFGLYGDGLLLVTDGSTSQLYDRRQYKKWGYLNKSGALQISVKYFGALPFSEGVAGVAYDNLKYAYITPNGSVVITNDFNKGSTIGAMGFYQDKAIVVGEKGLAYIDTRGRKASGSLIKFTPLENFYNTTNSYIRGEEGNLEFDNKGRITYLVNKQGEKSLLREELGDTPLSIIKLQKGNSNPRGLKLGKNSIAQVDGKLGLVTLSDDASVNVRINSEFIESTNKSTVEVQFAANSSSNKILSNTEVYCNDKLIASNIDITSSGRVFAVNVQNSTEEERVPVGLTIRILSNGLEILNQKYSTTIINKIKPTIVDIHQPSTVDKEVEVEKAKDEVVNSATKSPAPAVAETTEPPVVESTPKATERRRTTIFTK